MWAGAPVTGVTSQPSFLLLGRKFIFTVEPAVTTLERGEEKSAGGRILPLGFRCLCCPLAGPYL